MGCSQLVSAQRATVVTTECAVVYLVGTDDTAGRVQSSSVRCRQGIKAVCNGLSSMRSLCKTQSTVHDLAVHLDGLVAWAITMA